MIDRYKTMSMLIRYSKLLIISLLLPFMATFAQVRTETGINQYWEFTKNKYNPNGESNQAVNWETASLPHRVFDVLVNGKVILKDFNAAKKYGYLTAGHEKVRIWVDDTNGINIQFKPIKGEPILNAIQLTKIN